MHAIWDARRDHLRRVEDALIQALGSVENARALVAAGVLECQRREDGSQQYVLLVDGAPIVLVAERTSYDDTTMRCEIDIYPYTARVIPIT